MRSSNAWSRKFQNGVTLVEALVALLVLSIGLLGVAGLQMAALRNNHGAHLRSQATVLAYDIVDRMRANRRDALDLNLYNVVIGGTISGTSLPAVDVQTWKTMLRDVLPAGEGSVERLAGSVFRIRVEWTDQFGTQFVQVLTQI